MKEQRSLKGDPEVEDAIFVSYLKQLIHKYNYALHQYNYAL